MKPGTLTDLLRHVAAAPARHEAEAPPLNPGAVVGRFEIVRRLGRGGFGVVYEARDRELGRQVALKVVRPGRAEVDEGRVAREAEAIARLAHPNLITLYDVGHGEAGPYLVFELLRGKTLRERIDDGPMPLQEVVHVAVEVARGLAHAHAEGVVHRDLKASNVFVTTKGQVKILDFGMAHAFGHRRLTGGTPAYMAPEQWDDEPEDERTDVFALGVMLFVMLSGENPFPEGAGRWSAGPTTAPKLGIPGAPRLAELVGRMLDKAPRGRPRDGAAVLAALTPIEEALRAKPADGSPPLLATRRKASFGDLLAEPSRRRVFRVLVTIGLAAALPGGGWCAWKRASGNRPAAATPVPSPSIAVLPFVDLSPGKDQEYFADGVAEEILGALAQVKGLKVIGRTSSFSFKGKGDDLRVICQKLGVNHVLEGSVRRQGGRVRVTAQLIRAADGSNAWSEAYEREVADIFAVQLDVARSVAAALQIALGNARGSAGPRSTSAEAYSLFLLGMHLSGGGLTLEKAANAIRAFRQALALDPQYGPAWAALGSMLYRQALLQGAERGAPRLEEALAAGERAIALAPDQAPGYIARGIVREVYRWDWEGARQDYEKAMALDPVRALRPYGGTLVNMGRAREAIPYFERGAALDPFNASAWNGLGSLYIDLGMLTQARQPLERALVIDPSFVLALQNLGDLDLLLGRRAEALQEYRRIEPGAYRFLGLVMAYRELGREAESREALAQLTAQHGAAQPAMVAFAHAWRHDQDEALRWLERAVEQHDVALRGLKHNRYFHSIRGDPRFQALLRKMNLPAD